MPPDTPSEQEIVKRIHHLAQQSNAVKLTFHAEEQMEKRSIYFDEVLNILRKGEQDGDIKPAAQGRGYVCRLTLYTPRQRNKAAVVLVRFDRDRLKVITVMWRDIK